MHSLIENTFSVLLVLFGLMVLIGVGLLAYRVVRHAWLTRNDPI